MTSSVGGNYTILIHIMSTAQRYLMSSTSSTEVLFLLMVYISVILYNWTSRLQNLELEHYLEHPVNSQTINDGMEPFQSTAHEISNKNVLEFHSPKIGNNEIRVYNNLTNWTPLRQLSIAPLRVPNNERSFRMPDGFLWTSLHADYGLVVFWTSRRLWSNTSSLDDYWKMCGKSLILKDL